MTETRKQLLSQGSELWRRLILGEKKKNNNNNSALGIYHVNIINCDIYEALMKNDEIFFAFAKKKKVWN